MKTIFAYVDGSCRPNPGYSGYGIHLIIGDTELKSTQIEGKYKLTDRGYASKSNLKLYPAKNEYGIEKIIEVFGFKKDSNTNNRAELDAIIETYRLLPMLKLKEEEIEEVVILSDSKYALRYLDKILNNTLELDSETINKDKITELAAMVKICLLNTRVVKIKGHSDDLGNDRADLLALMGHKYNVRNPNEKEGFKKIEEDKNFWKSIEPDKDIFFGKSLFYFYNKLDKTYFMFNYKQDKDIGKKLSAVYYALIKKKEEDKDIDLLIKTIKPFFKNEKTPFIVYLDTLKSKKLYKDFIRYGKDFLEVDIERNYRDTFVSLKTVTGDEIIREVYPQLLSKKVNNNFESLEVIFSEFLYKDDKLKVKDITDMVYTKNKKDKTIIKPEFVNDKFKLKVKLDKKNFVYVYPKYDTPPRNTLKRFESKEPKVYLLYKVYPKLIEYYTLVDLEGTIILLTNFYANKIIKKK